MYRSDHHTNSPSSGGAIPPNLPPSHSSPSRLVISSAVSPGVVVAAEEAGGESAEEVGGESAEEVGGVSAGEEGAAISAVAPAGVVSFFFFCKSLTLLQKL